MAVIDTKVSSVVLYVYFTDDTAVVLRYQLPCVVLRREAVLVAEHVLSALSETCSLVPRLSVVSFPALRVLQGPFPCSFPTTREAEGVLSGLLGLVVSKAVDGVVFLAHIAPELSFFHFGSSFKGTGVQTHAPVNVVKAPLRVS
jgi:hypothetical protein